MKIALRNVVRRKLQTSLLGFMIFFTTFSIFVLVGLQTGAYKLIEDSYTQVFNGDLQIRNVNYNEIDDFDKMLSQDSFIKINDFLSNYSKTEIFFSPRYISFALGDYNNKNYSFQLIGVQPQTERSVSIVSSKLYTGEFLSDDSYNEIIIGKGLSEYFSLKVGDELIIMTSDIYDSFVIESFIVKGIYETGDIQLDSNSAFIHKNYFDDNISYDNNFNNITIKLDNSFLRNDLKKYIENNLTSNMKVLSWDEILPEIKQTIQFQFTVSMLFYILLIIIVSFTIINSMMLSTLKRMPEFGIYSSMGLGREYFKWILFFENFILSTIFVFLGSLAGFLFVYYFSQIGIPLPGLSEMRDESPLTFISNVIYPNMRDPILFLGPILIYISCMLAIIPPTLRLIKSNPIQSITSM